MLLAPQDRDIGTGFPQFEQSKTAAPWESYRVHALVPQSTDPPLFLQLLEQPDTQGLIWIQRLLPIKVQRTDCISSTVEFMSSTLR